MTDKATRSLVIGASSGIGAAIAVELARRGRAVALVARREAELQGVVAACNQAAGREVASYYAHDVRDLDAIPQMFASVVEDLGGLDEVVYAAAVMPTIERDEYSTEKDRDVLEIGLLGAMGWLNQAAPHMARQSHGVICGISSIAGDRGRRPYPAYHATKAGLDTFLESLRNRLAPRGVSVCTIKPGFVDTAMTQGMEGLFWVISPEKAARVIVRAMTRRKRITYVPWRWSLVAAVIKRIPSFVFRRMDF